jgi:NAD(P)H-flavin reductase/cytochrome b involved in lipid metabolism
MNMPCCHATLPAAMMDGARSLPPTRRRRHPSVLLLLLLALCTRPLCSGSLSLPEPASMPPNSFWLPDATTIGVSIDPKPTSDPTYTLSGSTGFRFTMTVNGVTKPTPVLVLQRGTNYTFVDNSDYNLKSGGQFDQHPMYIADATSIGQGSGVPYPGAPKMLQNNGQPGFKTKMTLVTEGVTALQKAMCPASSTAEVATLVKLNYQCIFHQYMGGVGAKILIVPSGWTYAASDLDPGAAPPAPVDPAGPAGGGVACSSNFQVTLLTNYKVMWKINKDTTQDSPSTPVPVSISFEFTADDILPNFGGFLGFGFGRTMIDTDLITMQLGKNSEPVITDSYTYSFQPYSDTSQGTPDNILNANATFNATTGIVVFSFTRLLNTGDDMDYIITKGEDTNVIFSHGASDAGLQYHGLNRRGHGAINFFNGAPTLSVEDSYNLNLVHGISMLFAWMVMYPVGGFIARYLKHWNWWLTSHELAQKFGSFGAVSFAGMALISSRTHLQTQHSVIGVAITSCLIFQIMLGEFSKWRIRTWKAKWYHRPIAKCHKYIGFFLISFGPYQVSLGIDLLWPRDQLARKLYWAALGCLLSAFVSAETYRRVNVLLHARTAKKVHDLVSQGDDSSNEQVGGAAGFLLSPKLMKNLPYLTWQQVSLRLKSGQKWLVISGVVLDVKPYLDSHPGGRTILEEALGTDSTLSFFGRSHESHDEDDDHISIMTAHNHSAFAWRKLESLAVGKLLVEEGEDELMSPQHGGRGTANGQDMELVKSNNGKSNLARLLAERKLQSKAPIGAAANYRQYRLVSRKWANPKGDCLVIRFEQSTHERPFIWGQVFDPYGQGKEVSVSITGEDEDVDSAQPGSGGTGEPRPIVIPHHPHSASMDISGTQSLRAAPASDAALLIPAKAGRRGSLIAFAAQQLMKFAAGNITVSDLAMNRRKTVVQPVGGTVAANSHRPSVVRAAAPEPSTTRVEHVPLPPTPSEGSGSAAAHLASPSHIQLDRPSSLTTPDRPAVAIAYANGNGGRAPSLKHFTIGSTNVTPSHQMQTPEKPITAFRPASIEMISPASAMPSTVDKQMGLRERGKNKPQQTTAGQQQHGTRSRAHLLLPGEHIELTALIDADHVERFYTPVPCAGTDAFEIVVKVYPLGTMTSWLATRRLGDYVKVRGPTGQPLLPLNPRGLPEKDATYPFVAMLAGGAGITPYLGVINYYLLKNETRPPHLRSRLALLYFNTSEDDIIFRSHLEDLAAASEGCLQVTFGLTGKTQPGWQGEVGRINEEIMSRFLSGLAPPDDLEKEDVKLEAQPVEQEDTSDDLPLAILPPAHTGLSTLSEEMSPASPARSLPKNTRRLHDPSGNGVSPSMEERELATNNSPMLRSRRHDADGIGEAPVAEGDDPRFSPHPEDQTRSISKKRRQLGINNRRHSGNKDATSDDTPSPLRSTQMNQVEAFSPDSPVDSPILEGNRRNNRRSQDLSAARAAALSESASHPNFITTSPLLNGRSFSPQTGSPKLRPLGFASSTKLGSADSGTPITGLSSDTVKKSLALPTPGSPNGMKSPINSIFTRKLKSAKDSDATPGSAKSPAELSLDAAENGRSLMPGGNTSVAVPTSESSSFLQYAYPDVLDNGRSAAAAPATNVGSGSSSKFEESKENQDVLNATLLAVHNRLSMAPSIRDPNSTGPVTSSVPTAVGGLPLPPNSRRATSNSRRTTMTKGLAIFTGDFNLETAAAPVPTVEEKKEVQPRIYICGPTDFSKACLEILQDMDVNLEVVDCL